MKISKSDLRLLTEAFRRYHAFHKTDPNPLNELWLGLGTNSTYGKSKYFQPIGTVFPRCLAWWTLSEKGIETFNQILKTNQWKPENNNDYFMHNLTIDVSKIETKKE